MAKKLGEEELKALVANEIRASKTYDDAELRQKRETALAYYMGDMEDDLPAEAGRSSAVSRDVADTVGWMLPGIIRVFTASDRMAICEPVGPEDEEWSEQASDGINHVFWKTNPGYKILYSATWDSLVLKNGIVKHWWDDTSETAISEHSGLSEEQVALLTEADGIEVLASTKTEEAHEQPDPATGEMVEVMVPVYDVKIQRTKTPGRIKIECIPPEDFLLDRDADCIENARFCGHKDRVTRSDLIEMGFDRKKVDGLSAEADDSMERLQREGDIGQSGTADESMTLVELIECYVRADVDGDGVAETVRCFYAGNQSGGVLLDWEVWEDEYPFSDIPCNPLPHRWEAESIADETMDIQRIKTVLTRQMLDNLYASNIPTRFAKGKISNPDELYSPSFGGVIFGGADAEVTNLTVPFVAGNALEAVAYQDQVIERRTGVSRATMALDPEALQNQTATASNNTRDAAYSQIELVARNQAELGWKRVFRAILRLMVKHQDRKETIRLRNKWVEIDPRHWNADMDININVGLGTGSRDRDMAMLNVVLANQMSLIDRFVSQGMGDVALTMLPKVLHTMQKSAESGGMKSIEQFFPDVTDEQIQGLVQRVQEHQAQGDPKAEAEAQKAQAQMQIEAQKMQADMQMAQAKMQGEMQMAQARLQADSEARQMEMALKREQLTAEMLLKREQLEAELLLKREQMQAEMMLRREMGVMAEANKASMATSSVRMGGDPG